MNRLWCSHDTMHCVDEFPRSCDVARGEEQQTNPEGDQREVLYHAINTTSLRAGVTGGNKKRKKGGNGM